MEFYENNEVDDQSCDSYISDDSSESDYDFNYDKLVDNLDELELFDEDLQVYKDEQNSVTKFCHQAVKLSIRID
jgi:hypothetical protein